jgi:hypothetical protein
MIEAVRIPDVDRGIAISTNSPKTGVVNIGFGFDEASSVLSEWIY